MARHTGHATAQCGAIGEPQPANGTGKNAIFAKASHYSLRHTTPVAMMLPAVLAKRKHKERNCRF